MSIIKRNWKIIHKYSIISIYLVMFTCALLQITHLFDNYITLISGFLFIFLAIFTFYLSNEFAYLRQEKSDFKNKHSILFISVVVVFFVLHLIGEKTTYIFGSYQYGDTLLPKLLGTPIAIGFIWYSTMLSTAGLIQKYSKINHRMLSKHIKAIVVAFFMMYFDILFEPVAVSLGYWSWQNSIVPFQNYIAWFVLSYVVALIGYKSKVLDNSLPKFVIHLYFAQLIYFVLIYFK